MIDGGLPHYGPMKSTTETPAPGDGQLAILLVISRIPRGRVASYGQVAALAGLPGRARLVGRILSRLPAGSNIPWFRVVNARGQLSFATDSSAWRRQYEALREEQIEFRGRQINLALYRWQP